MITSVSLVALQISECSSQQIRGLPSLRSSLATLSIHRSTETMMVQFGRNATQRSTLTPIPKKLETLCKSYLKTECDHLLIVFDMLL